MPPFIQQATLIPKLTEEAYNVWITQGEARGPRLIWYSEKMTQTLADIEPVVLPNSNVLFLRDLTITSYTISGRNYQREDFDKYRVSELFKNEEPILVNISGTQENLFCYACCSNCTIV